MNRRLIVLLFGLIIGVGIMLLVQTRMDAGPAYYSYGAASEDGIGKFYMGREISDLVNGHGAIAWLERQDRNETEKPEVLIRELQLKSDDVVADIGAGSGYFTFRIAPLIPKGRMIAVEIDDKMIGYLHDRKRQLSLSNVEIHKGDIENTGLPARSVDIAFMVDAYHEFSHPREMMESIVRALKPGGRVVLVEYEGEDPNNMVKRLHKMTVAQIRKEMEAVGLTWVRTSYDLPIQHITIFTKTDTQK